MTGRGYTVRAIKGVISTDDIIPGRYKHMFSNPAELAPHVFENRFPGFADSLIEGTALWSSDLFGIGSSREQAATSLLAAGVKVVLAPSFGRIFYRNAWNVGLRLIEVPTSQAPRQDGATLQIDWEIGVLSTPFGDLKFARPPARLLAVCEAGGLLNWVSGQRALPPSQRAST